MSQIMWKVYIFQSAVVEFSMAGAPKYLARCHKSRVVSAFLILLLNSERDLNLSVQYVSINCSYFCGRFDLSQSISDSFKYPGQCFLVLLKYLCRLKVVLYSCRL